MENSIIIGRKHEQVAPSGWRYKTERDDKSSIQHTFITTYGVAHNLHSGIVQSEVIMDDLFAP